MLKKCLDENVPYVVTQVYKSGWPSDPTAFDNADTIMLYMDGGGGHPLIQTRERLAEMEQLMKQGVGLGCAHYGVEVPKAKGGPELLNWIGGYFEEYWSVNPHWMLHETQIAKGHPITRGVDPFEIRDEWYYHMRFRENMEGVTSILFGGSTRRVAATARMSAWRQPGRTRREKVSGRSSPGRQSDPTAAAVSATPAATSTRIGASPTIASCF